MNSSNVAEVEQLSEPEFTHPAHSAAVYTFIFVLFFSICFECYIFFKKATPTYRLNPNTDRILKR